MKGYFTGKLMVRVTLNGCGLPLDDASVCIKGNKTPFYTLENGFTEEINIFSASEKGIRHNVDILAECDGFVSLHCKNVPIRSGYLTVWNMPLTKVKKFEKTRKMHDKSK
ncbi:MAG: hypothetical protein IKK94_04450 [Clostridia bacterium]|nr:hypothetical protein [Clostridia bacterium]